MEATAGHRFRDPADLAVLSSLQHQWAFMQARAVPGQISHEYVDTAHPVAALHLSRLLRRRHAEVFCLDDTGAHGPEEAERRAMLGDFLGSYFPFRAPWELPERVVADGEPSADGAAERITEPIAPAARRPPAEERTGPTDEQPVEPVGEGLDPQASFAQRMISPLTISGSSWWRKWPAFGIRRHS